MIVLFTLLIVFGAIQAELIFFNSNRNAAHASKSVQIIELTDLAQ